MKLNIIDELFSIFDDYIEKNNLPKLSYSIEKTKNSNWGDFSTNIAMIFSKEIKKNPLEIANNIIKKINSKFIRETSVTKPGFINIFLSNDYYNSILSNAISNGINFSQYEKKDISYNIEFVSANPTGSLHIGHARNAVLGSVLANVWEKFGIEVDKEYYINDGGSQINKLGISVLIRYKQIFEMNDILPEDSYKGNEPILVAEELKNKYNDKFLNTKYDSLMILDEGDRKIINDFSKKFLMDKIKNTLDLFKVKFNIYFPESEIFEMNLIEKVITSLKKYIYVKDGATWLKTTIFGDDKDRVLIKKDGNNTYFLPDIAYHYVKLSRKKYDKIFDIFGSDHGSYITRIKAACECLGYKDILEVIIMQMVKLTKNNKPFKMSKRSGESLTLNDLIDSIGIDAARWYLISKSASSHLEIDIDKVTKKDNTNPMYYVMYANARIAKIMSIFKNDILNINVDCSKLILEKERELINLIVYYPCLINSISKSYDVHNLNVFLIKISSIFHSYYSETKIINDDKEVSNQRINLIIAIKSVIMSCLKIMEIDIIDKI